MWATKLQGDCDGRIFGFSETGFAPGWMADTLVRPVPERNTEADRNVRALKRRSAHDSDRTRIAGVAPPA
jgi:hypothetical protein